MIAIRFAALAITAAVLIHAQTPAGPTVALWPGDRQAAISLTFDDAMASQLDNAGPILKRYGLHGTFFVTTGMKAWKTRVPDWQRVAAEGNEIGGHTVTHPCLQDRIRPHSEDYTPEMMEAELHDGAQTILREIVSRRGLTFAYPCGCKSFGPPAQQTRNSALFQRYISEGYFAARDYGWAGTVPTDALSILSVPDLGFTAGRDFRELLQMMDPALRKHEWGTFTFHGVGNNEGRLAVAVEALDELASYLSRHSEVWTAPFGDVIRYIQENRALGIRVTESTDQRLDVQLSWPLDPQIFDLPLTLKWTLPAGWTNCRISADNKLLTVRIVEKTALFDVPPSSRLLEITPH